MALITKGIAALIAALCISPANTPSPSTSPTIDQVSNDIVDRAGSYCSSTAHISTESITVLWAILATCESLLCSDFVTAWSIIVFILGNRTHRSAPSITTLIKLASSIFVAIGTFLCNLLYGRYRLSPNSSRDGFQLLLGRPWMSISYVRAYFLVQTDLDLLLRIELHVPRP